MNLSEKSINKLNKMIAKIKYGNLLYEVFDIGDEGAIQFTFFTSEEDGVLKTSPITDWIRNDALAFGLMIDVKPDVYWYAPSESEEGAIAFLSVYDDQLENVANIDIFNESDFNRAIAEVFILMSQENAK